MTLKEALRETCRTLEDISVPVGLILQIGAPIMSAVETLQKCIDAIPEPGDEQTEERAIREEDI